MPWRRAACQCLDDDVGRRVRQPGEDAACVQPAHARATEEGVPVDVARAQLAGCCVTPVGDADGPAGTEPTFGEVQAVPDVPTDPVVRRPAHERGVDAALEHEVLDEAPDVVVRQGGDDRGA